MFCAIPKSAAISVFRTDANSIIARPVGGRGESLIYDFTRTQRNGGKKNKERKTSETTPLTFPLNVSENETIR